MPLPTTTKAYYNEHDKFAAAWLRELIKAGQIADGDVDERDIQDVQPKELDGYTQCHFFAGIGVWSYALRRAGWPDDRPVWTGSCPCQPFSAAGQQQGHADPRHLWPEWFRLIRECQPVTVFGEQVEASLRHGWLDLVSADMEGEGYAVGAAIMGAHSVGAPHRRHRLYFVGERADAELSNRRPEHEKHGDTYGRNGLGRNGDALSRPDTPDARRNHEREHGSGSPLLAARSEQCGVDGRDSAVGERVYADGDGSQSRREGSEALGHGSSTESAGSAGDSHYPFGSGLEGHRRSEQEPVPEGRPREGRHASAPGSVREYANRIGATRGFWANCDWWYGRDEKYRPIESGLQPLAHGSPARVGRLRGYGNAIVAPLAEAFIAAYLEVVDERV